MLLEVVMPGPHPELAIPERTRRKLEIGAATDDVRLRRADLEVEARIGLEESLVRGLAGEQDLAFRTDLGRSDDRHQHIIELVVEIAGDGRGEDPVERVAAAAEQEQDPQRRNDDHAPDDRPGAQAEAPLAHLPAAGRKGGITGSAALPANSRGRGWW